MHKSDFWVNLNLAVLKQLSLLIILLYLCISIFPRKVCNFNNYTEAFKNKFT